MTLSRSNRSLLILLGILVVPSVAYLLISTGKNNYQKLDIYGPREPVAGQPGDTLYHTVPDYVLTDFDGGVFSSYTLKEEILVTNFFFATCQTICPKMSMQMKRVQQQFLDDPGVVLVSITVNPERDTVDALAAYAMEYGAKKDKWHLLTGDKKTIYELARNGFFLAAMPGDGGPDDFIHSEKLVLTDRDRRIRGYYDGTDYEDVNRLIDEIKVLQWEYGKSGN
jgi:protein SCO1/2